MFLVTLIFKEENAIDIKKIRPISLGNNCFKILTKAMTNRLSLIVDRLVSSNQTTFLTGIFIPESVVSAQEKNHEIHSTGRKKLLSKLIMRKPMTC